MAVSVGDIFVSLGFKVDDKQLKDFDGGIRNLTANILGTVAAVGASLYGIERFISSSTSMGAKIENVSKQTGIASEEIQKFGYAANAANSSLSFDQAINGLVGLRKALYDISIGQGNRGVFGVLGIDPDGKTVDQILNELARVTHGMDKFKADSLVAQTGLGNGLIPLLEQLYNNPNYMNEQGLKFAISDEDIATLAEGDRLLNEISKTIDLIKAKVTVGLFGGLKKGNELSDATASSVSEELKNSGGYFGLMGKQISGFLSDKSNTDPNAINSTTKPFSESLLGQGLKDSVVFMSEMNKKYGDGSTSNSTGDTNVNVTINGAQDPQEIYRVLSENIQRAKDQRAGSLK